MGTNTSSDLIICAHAAHTPRALCCQCPGQVLQDREKGGAVLRGLLAAFVPAECPASS